MKRLFNFKWSIVVLVLHLIISGYFAMILPADAKLPTHWNIHNQIDGYTAKTPGLLIWVGLNLFMFLMFFLMPWYSPWYKKYDKRFERLLPPLTLVMLLFFSMISIYSMYLAKTQIIPEIQFILILIGLMFIFLGNLLPKTPRNFFIGIKSPWTIANEEVWQRTHRLGGKLFVVSGLVMIVKGVILLHNSVFQVYSGVLVLLLVLYPVLYSFVIYKKLGSEKN